MACDLTLGRAVPCKDVVGGIDYVWFVNFGDLGALTFDADDQLTAIAGTATAYQYDVKGPNSLEETFTVSRDNGTTFFSQALNLTLPKLSKEDNKQLKLMAYGRPHVFVGDRNGNTRLVGALRGCEVTGGTAVTGAAMGDLNGYTLVLTGEEPELANFVKGATAADPFGDLVGITIVQGTNS